MDIGAVSEKEYNVQQQPHFLKVRFRHVRTCNKHDNLTVEWGDFEEKTSHFPLR